MPLNAAPIVAAYFERRQDLIRLFTVKMRSATQAEDLVQELYLKVAALGPDHPAADASALLYRIANNLMIDRMRGTQRSMAREGAWSSLQGGARGASDEPSPEAATSDRQGLRQLLDALKDLPPRTRRAFELHKLSGLTYAETAAAMGTTSKTVEKQISAALRQLVVALKRSPR